MCCKLAREIDQKLFDLIRQSEPDFAQCRDASEALVSAGADVNAKCLKSDIPDGHMLAVLLDESWRGVEASYRLDVVRFFLGHGFEPRRDDGRYGALALSHFVWLSFPNRFTLTGVKELLEAGCDPLRSVVLFDDEPQEQNALSCVYEGLEDAFMVDFDFVRMLGFSTIWKCLSKSSQGLNYASVGLPTDAYCCYLKGVYAYGDSRIEPAENEKAREFSYIAENGDPFDSGLVFDFGTTCFCLDPNNGAYCDAELRESLDEERRLDLGLDDSGGDWLISLRGRTHYGAEFHMEFNSKQVLIKNGKITVFNKDDSNQIRDAALLMLPVGY